jgi:putative ubiquitin-RnfH superfamily antitoxin RatB of RatAB toxin-antitoxin module
MARAEVRGLRVEVVYCPQPRQCERVSLDLEEGACLVDAVAASGICQRHGLDAAALRIGIWGRVQALQTPLRDQDRVELYRPLKVDPKEARRLRYRRHKR